MLSNVLIAVALARPTVGYCQGMNFVVGGLLIVGTAVGRNKDNDTNKNDLNTDTKNTCKDESSCGDDAQGDLP